MFSLKNVRFLPVRRKSPAAVPHTHKYVVLESSGISPHASIIARVLAAGERIRAERRARKVVPLAEYQRRSSAIPDSE